MVTEASPFVPPPPKFTAAEVGRRCLVTGGAGYVGSAIIRRLRQLGCEVRSFDLVPHDPIDGSEPVIGDLRDPAAVRAACDGVDTIFHTAALINLLTIYRPALRDLVHDVNVHGTSNLLTQAAAADCGAFVHTSTFNVVLDGPLVRGSEEDAYVARPRDLYAQTKILAERAVLEADRDGGLRVAALRPGGVWGCDTGSIMIRGLLSSVARRQFSVLIGDGSAEMDNTHVENLVDAQLLAARELHRVNPAVCGEAFFITDDEPVNPLEWFRPLVEALGETFPTRRLPAGMMRTVASVMEIAHFLGGPQPMLTRRGIRNLTESCSFRIDKAREVLGYAPRYVRENGFPLLLPEARRFIAEFDPNSVVMGDTNMAP